METIKLYQEAQSLTPLEHLAAAMCQLELQSKCASLDILVEEVERTWRRYIPEAECLLAAMKKRDFVLEASK